MRYSSRAFCRDRFPRPAVEFKHIENKTKTRTWTETSQAQVDWAVVVVAGWEMDLDHPEEHREKVARHRRLHSSTLAPSFIKAVHCSSVEGSSTSRLVTASCMQCFVRAVVACGRAATPPRRSRISQRTCTVLHMCKSVALKTEEVSQRTRSSIFFKSEGILLLCGQKGHPSKNGRSEPLG